MQVRRTAWIERQEGGRRCGKTERAKQPPGRRRAGRGSRPRRAVHHAAVRLRRSTGDGGRRREGSRPGGRCPPDPCRPSPHPRSLGGEPSAALPAGREPAVPSPGAGTAGGLPCAGRRRTEGSLRAAPPCRIRPVPADRAARPRGRTPAVGIGSARPRSDPACGARQSGRSRPVGGRPPGQRPTPPSNFPGTVPPAEKPGTKKSGPQRAAKRSRAERRGCPSRGRGNALHTGADNWPDLDAHACVTVTECRWRDQGLCDYRETSERRVPPLPPGPDRRSC